MQINNKLDSVIAGNVHVLTLGEKSEDITVIAGQFLPPPPPPLFRYTRSSTNRSLVMAYSQVLDVYLNRKSPCIGTALFMKWFREHYLKNKTSGNVLLLLDDYRAHCSSLLLLQTAVKNNVTVIRLPSHCTHTLQPLDK
jgi:hypothetical protein